MVSQNTLQSSNFIKPITLIPKLQFSICICLFLIILCTKIYDKRDDFNFEIVNFPFLDGDVPRSTSYRVYISQLIRFARASSYITDFNTRNKLLTQKLLKQGYWYHKLRKIFSRLKGSQQQGALVHFWSKLS